MRDFIPADAANRAVTAPPEAAGIAATGGGFLMVHPRNDAIGDRYTGCKVVRVVDTDQMRRLATLHSEAGVATWPRKYMRELDAGVCKREPW